MKRNKKAKSHNKPKQKQNKKSTKRKKSSKTPRVVTVNLKLRILAAIQNHLRTTGTDARKIILSPITALDLLKLKRADIGVVAEEAEIKGIAAFKGTVCGKPFEIREDCEDLRIE